MSGSTVRRFADGTVECDVAIVGGSLGGVAAALAACESGASVVLSEATDWLGGQMTSQGVSAFDEHRYIEFFGGTRRYYRLREGIRALYRERYDLPSAMPDGRPLNPGNGWVSALCFEPRAGVQVLDRMLQPHVEGRRLTILTEHVPVKSLVEGDRVVAVTLRAVASGAPVRVRARYYLDATDLGDLLPLTGTEYVTGAEARWDTGEPHASPDGPHPDRVQGFTYCCAVEHRPGEDHAIRKPLGYERYRDRQPYTFVLRGHWGEPRPFSMFVPGPTGLPPFWTYRRLVDGRLLDPSGRLADVAMINWSGNDYHWANVIDRTPAERLCILEEAKQLALGFLYWLQTEAPRDDGLGRGYPGLRLLPGVMGTEDGLSKAPYIRESRRIRALKRITEDEIVAEGRQGARAEPFCDSVGVGWYAMDLHDCVGSPTSMFAPTLPFQIPLGALIPQRVTNLLAACKNIGTTHLTNGAYRLHPVEWNIGESAGALAAHCCKAGRTPHQVRGDPIFLRRFQYALLRRGVPLAWAIDVPASHLLFIPTHMLLAMGAIPSGGPRSDSLELRLDDPLLGREASALAKAVEGVPGLGLASSPPERWASCPDEPVTRSQILSVLAGVSPGKETFGEQPTLGELCAALGPALQDAYAPNQEDR